MVSACQIQTFEKRRIVHANLIVVENNLTASVASSGTKAGNNLLKLLCRTSYSLNRYRHCSSPPPMNCQRPSLPTLSRSLHFARGAKHRLKIIIAETQRLYNAQNAKSYRGTWDSSVSGHLKDYGWTLSMLQGAAPVFANKDKRCSLRNLRNLPALIYQNQRSNNW